MGVKGKYGRKFFRKSSRRGFELEFFYFSVRDFKIVGFIYLVCFFIVFVLVFCVLYIYGICCFLGNGEFRRGLGLRFCFFCVLGRFFRKFGFLFSVIFE